MVPITISSDELCSADVAPDKETLLSTEETVTTTLGFISGRIGQISSSRRNYWTKIPRLLLAPAVLAVPADSENWPEGATYVFAM